MITRKKTPYGLFLLFLILFGIMGYWVGGLFGFEDLTLFNFKEKFMYVVTHPLHNWWNAGSLNWMGIAGISWIMFVGWYQYNYRNFQFGVEKGSEDWGSIKEICRELKGKNPDYMRILSQNVKVSMEEDVLSNNNMVVIASSGRYKTTGIVEPNIALKNTSFVMLDVKGNTQRKLGNYLLEDNDYVVRSLNMKEPWLSDRYNPFVYLENETDVVRTITNLQEATRKPNAYSGDPFWDDGVKLYLQSTMFAEWLDAKREHRKGSFNNFLKLINLENKKKTFESFDGKKVVKVEKSELQIYMDDLAEKYGADYPPVRDYRKLKEGAPDTVRSIVIMVNAMLSICETADMKRILSDDDIHIRDIGLGVNGNPQKKVALFLVMPDTDTSYNFFINIFYSQLFDILIRCADNEVHGPLPVPVQIFADEIYAGPKPKDMEQLSGTIRSRNISLIPILQSVAQLQATLRDEKWKVLLSNMAVMCFYGAAPADKDTHEWISGLLGKMTIDTRTDNMHSGKSGSGGLNFASDGRELMTSGEVKRMKRKECIVMIEGQYPIYDKKFLPWEDDKKKFRHIKKLGPYVHPVKAVYDEETLSYRTIENVKPLQIISEEEVEFYRNASKKDPTIKVYDIDETDFLYLNLNREPEPTEEDLRKMLENIEAKEVLGDPPEDVIDVSVPNFGTESKEDWNLTGTVYECLQRYAELLSEEEINEIVTGMEEGLSDKQIKQYFCKPLNKMAQFRRAFVLQNKY